MANEITVRSGLVIRSGNLRYNSPQQAFRADMSGTPKGPTPGALTVTTVGVDVDLSGLTVPGLVEITNLDETNYVEWGVYDPETLAFFPVGEILPGENYVLRLSRNFQEQYYGTGTGTSAGGETNRLHLKAHTASCVVQVLAFEA